MTVARLSFSGKRILDQNGNRIKLRGINEARWGTMTLQDVLDHKAQGFNVLRLGLRWYGLYDSPTSGIDSRNDSATSTALIDPAHLAVLDQQVQWCSQNAMWFVLLIDSNCCQCGVQTTQMQAYCDPSNTYGSAGHNVMTDADLRAKFIAVEVFLANRYKNVSYLAMIELMPEPNMPTATAADITAFYQEAMAALDAVDPTFLYLIGAGGGYNIKTVATAYIPGATRICYTGNLFVHVAAGLSDIDARLQPLIDLSTTNNVPVFVQQVGVRTGDDPSMVYQAYALKALNQAGIGWTWWEYTGGSLGPDEYGIRYKDALNPGYYITKTSVLGKLKAYAAADQSVDTTTLDQRLTDVLQGVMARQSSLGGVWNTINTREPAVYPYIVFSEIVSTTNNTLTGPSDLQNSRYQFDVFDLTASGAKSLRKALGQSLTASFAPPTSCVGISSFSVYEDAIKAFRASADYSLWYSESSGPSAGGGSSGGSAGPGIVWDDGLIWNDTFVWVDDGTNSWKDTLTWVDTAIWAD